MPTEPIWFRSDGIQEYRFLSNFYPCTITVSLVGDWIVKGPTLEHVYQAMKADSSVWANWVLKAGSPREAQVRGRQVPLREGWDADHIMRFLLTLKFPGDEALSAALLATGDAELIEDNKGPWGGRYGGENKMGKLLMERREELRKWV